MPSAAPSDRYLLARLIAVWLLIQAVAGAWPVYSFYQDFSDCKNQVTCSGRDTAREWDLRRAYISVFIGQVTQPVGAEIDEIFPLVDAGTPVQIFP